MRGIAVIAVLCAALAGCGGGGGSGSPSPSSSSTTPTTGTGTVNPVNSPSIVALAGGGNALGVDITVIAPGATTPPNAQDLGVATLTATRPSAFNTGDIIHRGATSRVLLFGPGLNGSMQVSIRGPSDITITDISGTSSTDGTPGITFTAIVSPTAALGLRTVVLQNANGDITTFTGGLEVAP